MIPPDVSDEQKRSSELNDIPKELLEMIFSRVNVSDRFRLKSVCKSWKNTLDDVNFILKPPSLPWMLLPPPLPPYHLDYTLSFYNISENKIHRFINLPEELKGSSYFGSSKGWMLLGKDKIHNRLFFDFLDPCFYLLNPLSMLYFKLPSILTIPKLMLEVSPDWLVKLYKKFSNSVYKFQLSSADAFNSTVAVIFGYNEQVLAVCKAGIDDSWTVIDHIPKNSLNYFMDIMFSKDGRVLYVLKDSFGLIRNFKNKEKEDIMTLTQHTVGCESIIVKKISNWSTSVIGTRRKFYDEYLVESIHGELLIVTTRSCCLKYLNWDHCEVGEIRVHVVHENNNGIGTTTRKLESLGEQVLFVGEAGSLSYKAHKGIEKNQIVFMAAGTDSTVENDDVPIPFRDCGVYAFDRREIKRVFRSIGYSCHQNACWFTPTP